MRPPSVSCASVTALGQEPDARGLVRMPPARVCGAWLAGRWVAWRDVYQGRSFSGITADAIAAHASESGPENGRAPDLERQPRTVR